MKTNQINRGSEPLVRRGIMLRAKATGLAAFVALGALLLGTVAHAGMYLSPTNSEGGVQAASVITENTVTSSNATLSWYGMHGWYTVEGTTNFPAGPWVALGTVAATDHNGSLTVTNPFWPDSATFRLAEANSYVGQGACSGCHGDKFTEWSGTAHASALSTLQNIGQGSNPACLPCHTVGKDQQTGFIDVATTPHLADVGCENCHGPAGWHKYSDHDLIRPVVSIDPKICGGCHQDSHHPTYEEYSTSLHAQVNDHVAPGGVMSESNRVGCGICHSAAARMTMLNDYEARQAGRTNALVLADATDAGRWTATCATCHDPHSAEANIQSTSIVSTTNVVTTTNIFSNYGQYYTNIVSTTNVTTATNIVLVPFQLRNPLRSTQYYTMPTTADKRTEITTNYSGVVSTNVYYMSAAFANMYDPTVQVCAQCHNSRGARWDGRSYGYYNTNTLQSVTTNGSGIAWGLQTNISLSRPPHHSVQYNVLIGILQDDYFNTNSSGVATNWIQRHGAGVSSVYNTNGCATCHVPSYAVNAGTNVTGHTFALDTKNCATSGCHGSVPIYQMTQLDVTNGIARVVDLLNQWAVSKGPGLGLTNGANNWDYTTTGALASTPDTSNAGPPSGDQLTKIPDAIKQARFNIYMLFHDGSLGVHNPLYATALIADAETKVMGQYTMANFRASKTAGFTPLSVAFTNLGTGATGYAWDFGDGQTSTSANPTNIYANPGTYAVTLTATDGVNSETVVRTNYIKVATRPVVGFTADQRTNSSPMTVSFTNASTSTNSVTDWRWTINSQNIYSENTVYTFTNVYATNISFNITYRAYTPGGNVSVTSNAFIVVTPAP